MVTLLTMGMRLATTPASSLKASLYSDVPHNVIPRNNYPLGAVNNFERGIEGQGSGWVNIILNKIKGVNN